MMIRKITIFATFLIFIIQLHGQESMMPMSILESLVGPSQETINRNDNLSLGNGQWTNLDRIYNFPRFQRAMEFIVINNRTDLLSNLTEISAYYAYLDAHPKVKSIGSQWQRAASNTTSDLRGLQYATMANILFANIFLTLKENDPKYKEYREILDQGISQAGLEFMTGTASQVIVKDVTAKYFSPLIRGELSVDNAFLFDADILYREQYVTLQPNYYAKFNDFDEVLMIGYFSELYGQINWTSLLELDFDTVDLRSPAQRFVLGMRIMGYAKDDIFEYLNSKGK